ncbi:hypothetical protein F4818DRAFT_451245 [Hypoxylon cercidicola]|nr:hypothetical protein F4818DRAFT_451245 [Hypoxylon cercidicola]
MARYTELDLKTFDVSSMYSDSALSVTSVAIISDIPSEYSPDELCRLVLEKQIWLVSPGLCRIQIIVDQSRLSMPSKEAESSFLEYLADAICECPLWATLGLTIKLEDIQHQPRWYDGGPNLFFIVEHPHKSSALLSPPHIPTARLEGFECLFCCNPDGPQTLRTDSEQPTTDDTDADSDSPQTTSGIKTLASINDVNGDERSSDPTQISTQWEDIACMAQMALYVLVGTKKCHPGLRLFLLEARPSLLELAPAIWNAHYLNSVTIHAASFPVISAILAASSQGQSPSTKKESAELFNDDDAIDGNSPVSTDIETKLNDYRSTAERKLWDLVQTTLEPTMYTKNTSKPAHSQLDELSSEPLRYTPHEADDLDGFENDIPLNRLENIGNHDIGFNNNSDRYWPSQIYGFQTQYNSYNPDIKGERTELINEGHAVEDNAGAENSLYVPDFVFQSQSQGSFPSMSSFSSGSDVYDTPTIQEHAWRFQ